MKVCLPNVKRVNITNDGFCVIALEIVLEPKDFGIVDGNVWVRINEVIGE